MRGTGAKQEMGGCRKRSMTLLSPQESDEEDMLPRIRHGSLGAYFDRIKHGMLEAMVGLEGAQRSGSQGDQITRGDLRNYRHGEAR